MPAEAQRRCDEPAALPGRRLTEREVTSLWGRDRSALRTCEERRAAAVGAAVSLGGIETGGPVGGAAEQSR